MSSPGIAATGPTWEARCGRDTLDHSGEGRQQDPHADHFIPWSRYPRDLALDDQPAALQVARRAYGQAEVTSAQFWVSLKYTVNADRRCLEILDVCN